MAVTLGVPGADDVAFREESGHVVVPPAAPPGNLRAVIDATWTFKTMGPGDPGTRYQPPARLDGMPELNGASMVEMYRHPVPWPTADCRVSAVPSPTSGTPKGSSRPP